MKIALIVNTRTGDSEDQVEFDPPHTIEQIHKAILHAGHEYVFIEGDVHVLENLQKHKPDLVFNRSEGLRGESRESHIPCILEMLGIPYVGSGPKTLAVCLDKSWTKTFVASHGVRTPVSYVVNSLQDVEKIEPAHFPVILKPNMEGSSIGINEDNVVFDRTQMQKKLRAMLTNYEQSILVESFIAGREFSVGVVVDATGEITVLPIVEVDFSQMPASVANVFGQVAKTTYDDLKHYVCPAKIDPVLQEQLVEQTKRVCSSLEIKEFARLDFRVDKDNNVWFLEINPLPGLDFDPETNDFSFYTLMAFTHGYTYDSLVAKLLDIAKKRYNL